MKAYPLAVALVFTIACGGCIPARVVEVAGASGTVIDAVSQAPIGGATVHCRETPEVVAQTDPSGHFSIPPRKFWRVVPLGSDWLSKSCGLVVSAPNYSSSSQVVLPGDDLTRTVRLGSSATASYTDVQQPIIPDTETECIAAGGHWTALGLPRPNKPKVCDLKATDKGKPCTDSRHCQGTCISPQGAKLGDPVVGSCSEYLLNYGTVCRVREGKVECLAVD
jgi:hypothetical protein